MERLKDRYTEGEAAITASRTHTHTHFCLHYNTQNTALSPTTFQIAAPLWLCRVKSKQASCGKKKKSKENISLIWTPAAGEDLCERVCRFAWMQTNRRLWHSVLICNQWTQEKKKMGKKSHKHLEPGISDLNCCKNWTSIKYLSLLTLEIYLINTWIWQVEFSIYMLQIQMHKWWNISHGEKWDDKYYVLPMNTIWKTSYGPSSVAVSSWYKNHAYAISNT